MVFRVYDILLLTFEFVFPPNCAQGCFFGRFKNAQLICYLSYICFYILVFFFISYQSDSELTNVYGILVLGNNIIASRDVYNSL